MADAKVEFTNTSRLEPDAVGEPGRRMFRILADSESSSAVLWIEKEHLLELAMGIQQLMATLPETDADGYIPPEREAPGLTRLDFRIGKLALGHDSRNGLFLIDAYNMEDAPRRRTHRPRLGRPRPAGRLRRIRHPSLRRRPPTLPTLRQSHRPRRPRLPPRQRPRQNHRPR